MPRIAPARSTPAQPTPPSPPLQGDPLRHEVEGLVYQLDALPRRQGGRKSVVSVRLAGSDPGPPLVDRCDLYAFRSRRALAQLVAETFGRDAGQVLGHLALVLDAVERARAAELSSVSSAAAPERLTPARRAAAEALLARRDLLDHAAAAMEALGHVGEEEVKRLCFLVALSRLLESPLSALLFAPPGSGKSAVLEAVAALVPPEHQVSLARLTAHSLFYAGPDALRHKLVLVDEYEGQEEADHAVRVLQSKGELTQAATVKGRAEQFLVRGPVAVMSGTTSGALDPQNTSRCLLLSLDDSPAQTRRIQAAQARAWAAERRPALDREPWHDAQRLLADELPVRVRVPFAAELRFPARTSADRRASPQLFALVAAHALLHARQRRREHGQLLATRADHTAVEALLRAQREQTLEDLSLRAARVYHWLLAERAEEKRAGATRREVALALGWGYSTARRALDELLAHELVRVPERGPPARYQLLDGGDAS